MPAARAAMSCRPYFTRGLVSGFALALATISPRARAGTPPNEDAPSAEDEDASAAPVLQTTREQEQPPVDAPAIDPPAVEAPPTPASAAPTAVPDEPATHTPPRDAAANAPVGPAPSPPTAAPTAVPTQPSGSQPSAPSASEPGTRAWSPETGQVQAPPPAQPPVPAPKAGAEYDETEGPGKNKRRGKKWGNRKPMIWPRLGVGAAFGSFNHDIRIGVGATYMLPFGIGFGLDFDDRIIIFRDSAKANFPGIEDETPTNIASLTPHLMWIILPGAKFTPYLRGGVGPVFYNNGLGVLGQWNGSAGLMMRIGGRLYVDLGANVSAQFPDDKYRQVWSYQGDEARCGLSDKLCSLSVAPRLGLSMGFAIGR